MVDDRLHEKRVQHTMPGQSSMPQILWRFSQTLICLEHRLIFKNIWRRGWDTSIKTYIKGWRI